ncbi:MAG: hypothetical protein HY017_20525 [Betaproteobacteria bacterium]|nr:hypothetical protein [Betaproteobacteria bacterium]
MPPRSLGCASPRHHERLVGADRVLLGTDYCFDMGLTDPVATIACIEGVTETERELIRGGTAARLPRLA